MRKILLTIAAMIPACMLWAQEPEAVEPPTIAPAETEDDKPKFVFLPEMELKEGVMNWGDLKKDLYYQISAPAEWKTTEADGNGWFLPENPPIQEYVSLSDDEMLLSWIDVEEEIQEQVIDSTVSITTNKKALESLHTVDVSGEYLDIVGTIKGHRQNLKSLQIMQYADKIVLYDNNKVIRILTLEPIEKQDVIKK